MDCCPRARGAGHGIGEHLGRVVGKDGQGNPIPCTTQTDGVRVCHGTDGGGGAGDVRIKSFDGTPLEAYAILHPAPKSGPTDNSR